MVWWLALGIAGLVTGCGGPTGDLPTVTAQDSAGVRVVVEHRPLATDSLAWLVQDRPVLDLTNPSSGLGHEFFRVFDAKRLPSRSLVGRGDGDRAGAPLFAGRPLER